jgi:restriction endonuclease S subunit
MGKTHTMVNEAKRNWIKFLPFRDVVLWDVKRYASEKIKSDYPIVKLSNHIQEQSVKVKLYDFPEEEFGILGVNNKVGIFDAYKEKGANINQSYKRMEVGWLAYNPYRVNVGSIGMRTEEHQYEYISPAYVVFSCKETLLPDFLYKLFKTERFNKVINESTTGSVRQNLTIDVLKSLDIALPSVEIQSSLLKPYYAKSKKAEAILLEIKNKEEEIEVLISSLLEIDFPASKEKRKGIYFSQYSEVNRWDIWVNENIGHSKKYRNGIFQEVVIGSPMYGANSKSVDAKSDVRYIRITDINEDGTLNEDFASSEKVETKFLLKQNDFLIARSGNTVGKTFLYNESDGKAIFAGYLVKYVLNLEKINPEYLLYFTKSRLFKNWIKSNQRISGQPNINGQEYLLAPIIIPPLEIQEDIVIQVKKIKDEIQKLKSKVETNQKEAITEFEEAIFKK